VNNFIVFTVISHTSSQIHCTIRDRTNQMGGSLRICPTRWKKVMWVSHL